MALMSEAVYTIDVKSICAVFERPYVPRAARNLSLEQQAEWTFVILPCADADNVADTEFANGLNSPTGAELQAAQEAAKADPTQTVGLTALLSREQECRLALQFWRLRRFVRPPRGFAAYWEAPASAEGGDPLRKLPGVLIGELHNEVWSMILRSVRYLPTLTDEADSGAEAAAGK